MTIVFILWLTILLQLCAAALAFALRFVARQRWAWMLIAVGLVLMSFRQAWVFSRFMSGELEAPPDHATELVALAISMIMLTGMVLMHQIARSEGRLSALIEKHIRDLTAEVEERRRVGATLRETQEQTRQIIETAYDAFIQMDSGGLIREWNRQAEIIFGWSRDEVLGRSMSETIVPLPDREAHRLGFQRFLLTGEGPFLNKRIELTALHRQGHGFPVEITVWPVRAGSAWAFNAFVRDITVRRRTEKELARRAEELERSSIDLDQFARVASHDLQEPLRSISSYVQLLQQRYEAKLDPDAEQFIRYASEGAARMQRIIEDLLAYTQTDRTARVPEPADMAVAVEEALSNLRTAIAQSGATVSVEDLPTLKVDRGQIVILFHHLLDNAIKFRGPRPPVIRIWAERRGDDWQFHVRDNGIGFDPSFSEKIFAIFQRLHGRAEFPGTGIGLAICKKIVARHRGRIWAESQPEEGSTFLFTLPAKGDTTVTTHYVPTEAA
jgi:PAS domain S-box-containing protein